MGVEIQMAVVDVTAGRDRGDLRDRWLWAETEVTAGRDRVTAGRDRGDLGWRQK